MSAAVQLSRAGEINRLHAAVLRDAAQSRAARTSALGSAWRAGQLLRAERKRVRRCLGPGAWGHWLARHFVGRERTAQRSMRLAQAIADPAFLPALSLRQAYVQLGIATEPTARALSPAVPPLPEHLRFARRLAGALRREKHWDWARLRDDLAELHRELQPLVANHAPADGIKRACMQPPERSG